jgi:predicted nuclease of restriction endonuclease-like (RecB) superfamily
VLERLAADLHVAFPDVHGFSRRDLGYMRSFAAAYRDGVFVQQLVAQIPWGHNVRILDKVKDAPVREWYARQTIEHGWSRDVLVHQIESRLYERQGGALTNFERTLPAPQSELARQLLKDPYNFDFLMMGKDAHERDLERGLLEDLREFLLELGVGFAFVGSQYHLEVGEQDFYIDLLFYHLRLRCFVVIDLKMGAFQPEYVGKINFYLSVVDDVLRQEGDAPSVGLLLCKTKDRVVAEYALRDIAKPIGVSDYQITDALSADLRDSLPTVEQLEAELASAQVP